MEIPITPFSNMASGYQAINPGFRAVLRSEGGEFIAGGDMNIDAVLKGSTDDASRGSAYGKLVLKLNLADAYPGIVSGLMQGKYKGRLSICMAKDPKSEMNETECKNLTGNIHPNRPFQWLDKPVEFEVQDGNVRITRYFGSVGEGGTSEQISLAVFHPAFGFAAPGKAFKDYQSPLVLDLSGNDRFDMVNVWDESPKVRFDFSGEGQRIRTGWVRPQDAFLFWDEGTGCVLDGRSLLGEFTDSNSGEKTFENGFEALRKKTKLSALVSSVEVARFPQLKLWQDKNQDGVCQTSEVTSASVKVKSISLKYKTIQNPKLQDDNEVRVVSSFETTTGKRLKIADIWFKLRRNSLAGN
jgi:hypothetical protein